MVDQHFRCPIEYSCPLINQLQMLIEDAEGLDDASRNAMLDKLEDIREINRELREWGSGEASDADDLSAQLELHFPYDLDV